MKFNNQEQEWQPPQEAKNKIPYGWGSGQVNKKKIGWRWRDPNDQGNIVRIDKGEPTSRFPSQQVNHVRVNKNGQVIGRNGNPITASPNPSKTEESHIPLTEWLTWKTWYHP